MDNTHNMDAITQSTIIDFYERAIHYLNDHKALPIVENNIRKLLTLTTPLNTYNVRIIGAYGTEAFNSMMLIDPNGRKLFADPYNKFIYYPDNINGKELLKVKTCTADLIDHIARSVHFSISDGIRRLFKYGADHTSRLCTMSPETFTLLQNRNKYYRCYNVRAQEIVIINHLIDTAFQHYQGGRISLNNTNPLIPVAPTL